MCYGYTMIGFFGTVLIIKVVQCLWLTGRGGWQYAGEREQLRQSVTMLGWDETNNYYQSQFNLFQTNLILNARLDDFEKRISDLESENKNPFRTNLGR